MMLLHGETQQSLGDRLLAWSYLEMRYVVSKSCRALEGARLL